MPQRAVESADPRAETDADAEADAADAEHRGLSGARLRTTTTTALSALGERRAGGGRALATRLAPRGTRTGAIQSAADRLAIEMGMERELCVAVVQRYGLPRGRMELRNAANALPSNHLRELRDDVHACIARHLTAAQWERRMHFLVASERESAATAAAAASEGGAAVATTTARPRSARAPPRAVFYDRATAQYDALVLQASAGAGAGAGAAPNAFSRTLRRTLGRSASSHDATPAPPPPTPALQSPSLSGGGSPANDRSPCISRHGSRPGSRPSTSRRTSSLGSLAELGVFGALPAACPAVVTAAAAAPPHARSAPAVAPAVRSFASLCDTISHLSVTVGEGAALLIAASGEAEAPSDGGSSSSSSDVGAAARAESGGAPSESAAARAEDAPIDAKGIVFISSVCFFFFVYSFLLLLLIYFFCFYSFVC